MLGFLAYLGIRSIASAKKAYDNYDMKKSTQWVDSNGNVHWYDSHCQNHVNGEKVMQVRVRDSDGLERINTVGVKSYKVYNSEYSPYTKRMLEFSEENKRKAIKYGDKAYNQYNPYFGECVTTEIETNRTITCLYKRKDKKTGKTIYKKWYFRPERQGKYDYNHTVEGDYGINITEEEYKKLKILCGTFSTIPNDLKVWDNLWTTTTFK